MKQAKSKSEERRIAIQAEEKLVTMEAVQNTTMADGTFVFKGQKVEVTAEYAERVKRENNKSFKF